MPKAVGSEKVTPKKGIRGEEDSRRVPNVFVPRAPRVQRRIVNPRGNRKGR